MTPLDQAKTAPKEPGVYIMRDGENRIIYVGKARILRNRLASYFSGEKDIKTRTLLRHAVSIETIIVKDEYEALLLENTLIKQHSPRYNINLKDGKTYPVIRLTAGPFPRVFRTRHVIEDGSSYYGPFPNVGATDTMLDIIDRNFPLRKCRTLRKRENPCMYYHIGRCLAPCCGRSGEADYALQAERVRKLLAGDTAALIADLKGAMKAAAGALRFEEAARLRNALSSIEGLGTASAVVDFDPQGRDYIAWAAEGVLSTFSVFSMRGGKLTGRELYRARSASDEETSLVTFITGYYHGERPPPALVYLMPFTGEEPGEKPAAVPAMLAPWFRKEFNLEPELAFALGGRDEAVMAMVRQNAREDLLHRLRERGAGPALDELKTALGLETRPERIEGFDIAQLDGKYPVASLVSFHNGAPDKKNYRRFKLRTVAGVVDDFAAMREAVSRRYSRLVREDRELPDLVLVDGGIGQVNAARGVLDELGLDCPVAGLAKRDEEIWLPGARSPVKLSRRSEALKVLQHIRDETHRFATSLNQKLRSVGGLRLETLESVEGIGPARAAALLKHYQTLENIAAAEPEAISHVCRCGIAAARAARAAARLSAIQRKAAPRSRAGGQNGVPGGSGPATRTITRAIALAEEALSGDAYPPAEQDGAGLAAEPEEEYR